MFLLMSCGVGFWGKQLITPVFTNDEEPYIPQTSLLFQVWGLQILWCFLYKTAPLDRDRPHTLECYRENALHGK